MKIFTKDMMKLGKHYRARCGNVYICIMKGGEKFLERNSETFKLTRAKDRPGILRRGHNKYGGFEPYAGYELEIDSDFIIIEEVVERKSLKEIGKKTQGKYTLAKIR